MRLTSSAALRGTFALLATAAIVTGVSACSSSEEPEESTSSEAPADSTEESAAPEESSEAPEAAAEGTLCTGEQMTTLSAASGQTIPDGALAGATATYEPAAVIGDLPASCLITVEQAGAAVSFAVLPGGTATFDAVEANVTAAGATPTSAAGTLTATIDDAQVIAVPFTTLTTETAGFENVDDLIVVVATPAVA